MIQIDFWTQITMLSSWSGHVSVSGWCEWKAQSVSVIEAQPTHLHQGMLITRAWPGPLWAGRDKENQFLSCQTLPPPDLRLGKASHTPATYCPDAFLLGGVGTFCVSTREKTAKWIVENKKKNERASKRQRERGGPGGRRQWRSRHLCDWAEVKPIEYLEPILSVAGEMRYWQCCWELSQLSRLIGLGGRPWANWICCGLINSGKLFYLLFWGGPVEHTYTHAYVQGPFFLLHHPTRGRERKREKHRLMEAIFLSLFPADQSKPGKKGAGNLLTLIKYHLT